MYRFLRQRQLSPSSPDHRDPDRP